MALRQQPMSGGEAILVLLIQGILWGAGATIGCIGVVLLYLAWLA